MNTNTANDKNPTFPSRLWKLNQTLPALFLLCSVSLFFAGCADASKKLDELWKTSLIERRTIEESVSSTGNLKAVGTVSVQTQVTGTLEAVLVDFNDTVQRGQVLARLNTDKMSITLKETLAALEKAKAQHEYNELVYTQNQKLREQNLISEAELAEKRLSWLSSRSSLIQAEAAEETARLNIEQYATILSPVNGIVLSRKVDPGQTVVAGGSSNTELFILAEDLESMQIEVKVDELDISKIHEGQAVRFSVEAWPDRNYEGTVSQIRKLPSTTNNVVSYTVIVDTQNKDGSLLPGMTATADFIITQKQDVLVIPSAALRFTPSDDIAQAARRAAFIQRLDSNALSDEEKKTAIARYDAALKENASAKTSTSSSGGSAASSSSILGGGMPGVPGMAPPGMSPSGNPRSGSGGSRSTSATASANGTVAAGSGPANGAGRQTIWILEDDGSLSMQMVRVGTSDMTNTEILDADYLEGKKVITRALSQ